MTSRAHRSLLALICLTGMLLTAFALISLHDLGKAYANVPTLPGDGLERAGDPSPHVVDPVVAATATTDDGWALVEAYGPIWGGMLLAFGLASAFIKRNEGEHWLAEGRRLALVTGVVGVLGALLQVKLGNSSFAGVVVTLMGAVKLALSPHTKAA
jgi:di/tricarboxylate transporter